MARDGLPHVSGDRHLELTDDGRTKAVRVMRKHRLAERLLVDVIGLEWEFVHDEACRWEHVMSDRVERKLVAMLLGPTESPYGNPIPGLEELGGVAVEPQAFRTGVRSLLDTVGEPDGVALVVRRLGEPVQSDPDLMAAFARAGLRPGATVRTWLDDGTVAVQVQAGKELRLDRAVASHVFVTVGS
jgi:DtxR family Mn-dependent transcriptional regulator